MGESAGVMVSSTTIIAVVISIVGFLMTGMITIIGGLSIFMINRWIKKNDEKEKEQKQEREKLAVEMKTERETLHKNIQDSVGKISDRAEQDKKEFEGRLMATAEAFGKQLTTVGGEFMTEIKEVKKSVADMAKSISDLTHAFSNAQKEANVQFQANAKRLDEQYEEISKLRSARHESDGVQTRMMLNIETNTRSMENMKREAEQIREEGFRRISDLEEKVFKKSFGGVPKVK